MYKTQKLEDIWNAMGLNKLNRLYKIPIKINEKRIMRQTYLKIKNDDEFNPMDSRNTPQVWL